MPEIGFIPLEENISGDVFKVYHPVSEVTESDAMLFNSDHSHFATPYSGLRKFSDKKNYKRIKLSCLSVVFFCLILTMFSLILYSSIKPDLSNPTTTHTRIVTCSYTNVSNYIEYIQGNGNLIISAPHDGNVYDDRIPSRDSGCWQGDRCNWADNCTQKSPVRCKITRIREIGTSNITRLMAKEYERLTGKRPHVIISHLNGDQMDPNLRKTEGTSDNPRAGQAWEDFHGYIELSKCLVKEGLYLDIHGYATGSSKDPTLGKIILGYRIDRKHLNAKNFSAENTTIGHLAGETGRNLITGDWALGTLLDDKGYASLPSKRLPFPGKDGYSGGGYDVLRHGALSGGKIDAIEIEVPLHLRRPARITNFAGDLAEVVVKYQKLLYSVLDT